MNGERAKERVKEQKRKKSRNQIIWTEILAIIFHCRYCLCEWRKMKPVRLFFGNKFICYLPISNELKSINFIYLNWAASRQWIRVSRSNFFSGVYTNWMDLLRKEKLNANTCDKTTKLADHLNAFILIWVI